MIFVLWTCYFNLYILKHNARFKYSLLFPLISKTNTMYASLSNYFQYISIIIKTIRTFSTIKNILLVERFLNAHAKHVGLCLSAAIVIKPTLLLSTINSHTFLSYSTLKIKNLCSWYDAGLAREGNKTLSSTVFCDVNVHCMFLSTLYYTQWCTHAHSHMQLHTHSFTKAHTHTNTCLHRDTHKPAQIKQRLEISSSSEPRDVMS